MNGRLSLNDDGCAILLPRSSLASCIFCAMVSDTRSLELSPENRVNYFPTNPFAGINLFFEGSGALIDDLGDGGQIAKLPTIVFSGPQRQPRVSMNPGPVYDLWIGFYPEALHAIGGPSPEMYFDKSVDALTALAPHLARVLVGGLKLGRAEAAFEQLQDAIEPMWLAKSPDTGTISRRVADWARHLAMRAATTRSGRSVRQIERRFKSWTGQTQRELAMLQRSEELFRHMMARIDNDHEDWARLALDTGFSDQSHLVRQAKRATGFSPADLRKRIRTERPFWVYRLIGQL